MVKKLYKHEFKAWLRVIPLFWVAMVGIAVAGRLVQLFENDSIYYKIIFVFSLIGFVLAAIVMIGAPVFFGIYRFYRNLFTGEGYLSFTLPVTSGQHLWVKVSTAVCLSILSFLVVMLSGVILVSGDVLTEILKAMAYLWKQLKENIPGEWVPHLIGYAIEYTLIFVISMFATYLMYGTCICIGQLARKNRVLVAVGVYFGFQVVAQMLSTGFSLIFTVLNVSGTMEKIVQFATDHPFATGHMLLGGSGLFVLLLTTVYWFVCHGIMRKRLNLE